MSGKEIPSLSGDWIGWEGLSNILLKPSPASTTGTSALRASPRISTRRPVAENSSFISSGHWQSLNGISSGNGRMRGSLLPEHEEDSAADRKRTPSILQKR